MDYAVKRRPNETLSDVQQGNRAWWTKQTMSYDWNDKVERPRFSQEWFDEIDRRFIAGAKLYGHDARPFDRIIPFERLAGKRVLEVGSGMGLHSELMARAGASVSAIDISDTSVEATTKRAQLKGLNIDARQMDATELAFPDQHFDFVWSWGVIHHSARTGRVIKEIHRVLKPGGETRVMVYNLGGMPAYMAIVRSYLLGFWRGRSLDDCLWNSTDGYMARFYTKDALADLFNTFFDNVTVDTMGQEPDVVPLPGKLRRLIAPRMSADKLKQRANARGAFLFVTAR